MTLKSKKIRCAVIGVGYLGQYHAEKYTKLSNAELVAVCDLDSKRAQEIINKLDGDKKPKVITDYRQLSATVDAVSIVTPTQSHFEIAKFFLENNIHVLLEKPMTHSEEQAKQLIDIAKQNNCLLQIGHIERYNSSVVALGPLLDKPRYIESTRHAPFKTRGTEVNVVFDMMIHDIDIIQSLVDSEIKHISASGVSVLSPLIDISNARLTFENGTIANVTASRVSLKAERSLRIFQHNAYLSIDLHNKLIAQFHKVKQKDNPEKTTIISEEQHLEQNDALLDQLSDFIYKIQSKQQPLVCGEQGLRAIQTATEITKIMRQSKDWDYHAELKERD